MKNKKRRSFTIIEIIVAIIVIAILVRIALPRYNKAVEQSRMTEAYSMLKNIYASQMRYAAKNDAYASSGLDIGTPQGKYFTFAVLANNPTPSATSIDNETLAVATRNSLGAGVFPANYDIGITELGDFYSTFPVVTFSIAVGPFQADQSLIDANQSLVVDNGNTNPDLPITPVTPDPALLPELIQNLQSQGLDNGQIVADLTGQGYTAEQIENILQTLNPPPPPLTLAQQIAQLQAEGLSNADIIAKMVSQGYSEQEVTDILSPPPPPPQGQFVLNISVDPKEGGQVEPSGIVKYDEGTSVAVTATPLEGYRFVRWELESRDMGTDRIITVTMDQDHTLLARFEAGEQTSSPDVKIEGEKTSLTSEQIQGMRDQGMDDQSIIDTLLKQGYTLEEIQAAMSKVL